jgi:hypothetical protein
MTRRLWRIALALSLVVALSATAPIAHAAGVTYRVTTAGT